jgi:hypothetical protein
MPQCEIWASQDKQPAILGSVNLASNNSSSVVTVLIETSITREIEAMEGPSQSISRIRVRLAKDRLFI